MPSPSEPRSCPVCGSVGRREMLHRQRFESGLLGDGYSVVVCTACGAGFADGIPDQATLDAYYAERSKYAVPGAESPYDHRRFAGIVGQLAPELARETAILDVGCATGGLPAAFRQAGFRNAMGADPSRECARIAREVHGVEVAAATIWELGTQGRRETPSLQGKNRLGLITLVGVLEHIREARLAVEAVTRLLDADGRVFIAVPDVQGLTAARNAPFQQFSMEHVNFFSRESLANLMATCGFAPSRVWQGLVEWREGVTEPVLGMLFERRCSDTDGSPARVPGPELPGREAAMPKDLVSGPAIERYIAASLGADIEIAGAIQELVDGGKPLLIWGTGALTRRLLAETSLGDTNILAFVDSNAAPGATLAGRPILPPDSIRKRKEPILVCSVAFEKEIEATVREKLGMHNPLIRLPAVATSAAIDLRGDSSLRSADLRKAIRELISEPVARATEREKNAFTDLLKASDGSIVLFGAGRLGRLCARALRKAGIPLRAFCDNNPALHGLEVEGAPVLSPSRAAAEFGAGSLFCVSIWTGAARESMASRMDFLRKLGCRHVDTYAPLVWAHGRDEIPFHSFGLPSRILAEGGSALSSLTATLEDEESLQVLTATLRQRLLGEFSAAVPAEHQYFLPDLTDPHVGDVLVDGGAYTGDTLTLVLSNLGALPTYHAFEPDPANLGQLQEIVDLLPAQFARRVHVHPVGLYSRTGTVRFAGAAGVSSAIASKGGSTIRVAALDDLDLAPTFVKLDIEGAELEALKGAAATLRRCYPKVAVCVYHRPDDLWSIPALLRQLLPYHRFYLRQHGYDGWETVLYAVGA